MMGTSCQPPETQSRTKEGKRMGIGMQIQFALPGTQVVGQTHWTLNSDCLD